MGDTLLESGECCCIFPGAFVTDVWLFPGVYEQPRCSANIVAQGHGKFGPIIVADSRKSFRQKKSYYYCATGTVCFVSIKISSNRLSLQANRSYIILKFIETMTDVVSFVKMISRLLLWAVTLLCDKLNTDFKN